MLWMETLAELCSSPGSLLCPLAVAELWAAVFKALPAGTLLALPWGKHSWLRVFPLRCTH